VRWDEAIGADRLNGFVLPGGHEDEGWQDHDVDPERSEIVRREQLGDIVYVQIPGMEEGDIPDIEDVPDILRLPSARMRERKGSQIDGGFGQMNRLI